MLYINDMPLLSRRSRLPVAMFSCEIIVFPSNKIVNLHLKRGGFFTVYMRTLALATQKSILNFHLNSIASAAQYHKKTDICIQYNEMGRRLYYNLSNVIRMDENFSHSILISQMLVLQKLITMPLVYKGLPYEPDVTILP